MSERVATIDIGTNTVLLLVAEIGGGEGGSGAPEPVAVEEHATITRLGEGVDRTRTFREEALARTLACLDRYAAIAARHGVRRAAVVGTSAMRDARGGERIVEHVRRTMGVELEIIGGEREAALTFEGSLVGLRGPGAGGDVAVFDIGGGSTEVVFGARGARGEASRITYARSFDVGSVRMTERHAASDPPAAGELDAVRRDITQALRTVPPLPAGAVPVGIAGTVTTLAAVSMGLTSYDPQRIHGSTLTATELRRVVDALARMPLAERQRVPGLEPKRADVIVAGGAIALALLEHWNAESLTISDRGVRWGLAVALGKSAATV